MKNYAVIDIETFDAPWVEYFMQRHFDSTFIFKNIIDTMLISKKLNVSTEHSLEYLCKKYNIVNDTPHRCVGDCYATRELFLKLTKN